MLRTRTAILHAAGTCVERDGLRRTTMSEIAGTAGVAKATLYNHFRTKDDVLAALVDAQVAALGSACAAAAADRGLAAALETAASELAGSGPLRRVAKEEPGLLAPLAVPEQGRGWEAARTAVTQTLAAADVPADPAAAELVLRWLVSQLLWPVEPGSSGAQRLAAGLGAGASTAPSPGRPTGRAQAAGLGWPDEPATLRPE